MKGIHAAFRAAGSALLVAAITATVVACAWRTVPGLDPALRGQLDMAVRAGILVFTLEYLARIAAAPRQNPAARRRPWRAVRDYMLSPFGIIDLLAVVSNDLDLVLPLPGQVLEIAPLLAILKLARYVPAMPLVAAVFRNEGRALLGAVMVMGVLMVLAAAVMYELERAAQPEVFKSIPHTLWWGIVTIASVGYGDMIPVTVAGRIFGGIVMLLGIAMFAVPAGILATGFAAEIRRRDFVVTWHLVAKVPLFSDMDATAIATIARLLRPQTVPANYAIVRRGDVADAMYFILSGEVEVDVQPAPVHLRSGQFFGEIALIEDVPRTATVTAATECQLLVLDAGDFRRLMAQHPQLREKIARVAAARHPPRPDPPSAGGGGADR